MKHNNPVPMHYLISNLSIDIEVGQGSAPLCSVLILILILMLSNRLLILSNIRTS